MASIRAQREPNRWNVSRCDDRRGSRSSWPLRPARGRSSIASGPDGVIRCGGVSRPGLVGQSPDGHAAAGLYLDLCRAIGAALLGPEGRIEFHLYDSDASFERVRTGADDLCFLDGAEIIDHDLAGKRDARPGGLFPVNVGDGPRRRADPAIERSCRQIDLLPPGRERASKPRSLDGGPSYRLRSHGLYGIRGTRRRV